MALSNAEKQRDYRRRQRERREAARSAVAMMPVAEHEAKTEQHKVRVAQRLEREAAARQLLEAELESARDAIARLEEKLEQSGNLCPVHHTELACRECSRGEDYC